MGRISSDGHEGPHRKQSNSRCFAGYQGSADSRHAEAAPSRFAEEEAGSTCTDDKHGPRCLPGVSSEPATTKRHDMWRFDLQPTGGYWICFSSWHIQSRVSQQRNDERWVSQQRDCCQWPREWVPYIPSCEYWHSRRDQLQWRILPSTRGNAACPRGTPGSEEDGWTCRRHEKTCLSRDQAYIA